MTILIRILVIAWAVVSIGLAILAFAAVSSTGGSVGAAAYEAAETVPEAAMQVMGFHGAPLIVVFGYWLALIAAIFVAFRRRASTSTAG